MEDTGNIPHGVIYIFRPCPGHVLFRPDPVSMCKVQSPVCGIH